MNKNLIVSGTKARNQNLSNWNWGPAREKRAAKAKGDVQKTKEPGVDLKG